MIKLTLVFSILLFAALTAAEEKTVSLSFFVEH